MCVPMIRRRVVTRLGNWPTFSRRAMCCGEYKTSSFSWRFERILITIVSLKESIAMPRLQQSPRNGQAIRKMWLGKLKLIIAAHNWPLQRAAEGGVKGGLDFRLASKLLK